MAGEELGAGAGKSYSETTEANYVTGIRSVVGKQLFDTIQFITSEKQEMFGSPWQKQVCAKVGVLEEHQQLFWKRKGMQEARRSLNRRRQNTTTAMKKHFLGKTRMEEDVKMQGSTNIAHFCAGMLSALLFEQISTRRRCHCQSLELY